jgi:hypothetical protein
MLQIEWQTIIIFALLASLWASCSPAHGTPRKREVDIVGTSGTTDLGAEKEAAR